MEIRKVNAEETEDFIELLRIFRVVFEHDSELPGEAYLRKMLNQPEFIVFVVKQKEEVIGGLTIHVLQSYYIEKPVAYIYDVAIRPENQGKGVGKALIAEVCRYLKDLGFQEMYVEAEAEDIEALSFYRQTGCSAELNAIHFTYDLSDPHKAI